MQIKNHALAKSASKAFKRVKLPADKFGYCFYCCLLFGLWISGCNSSEKDAPAPAPITNPAPTPQDTVPAPQAGFVANLPAVIPQQKIVFYNTSRNAIRYKWDFGNGFTFIDSTKSDAIASYNQIGNYDVQLTAYNSEGDSSIVTQILKVGEWYLTGFTFECNNFQAAFGNLDPADGPDFNIRLNRPNTPVVNNFTLKPNVTAADFPIKHSITPIKINKEIWHFTLDDIDAGGNQMVVGWDNDFNMVIPYCFSTTCKTGYGSNYYTIWLNMELR